jgi:hypothetical protein
MKTKLNKIHGEKHTHYYIAKINLTTKIQRTGKHPPMKYIANINLTI